MGKISLNAMMQKMWRPAAVSLVALSLMVSVSLMGSVRSATQADQWTFTSIDVPDAISTNARAISPTGEIVGIYTSADNKVHGFLLSQGQFTTIDVPDATATRALGINRLGEVVGNYSADGRTHGFLLYQGQFTTIDVPDATNTTAEDINADGDITGVYWGSGAPERPFVLSEGKFTTFELPSGVALAMGHGINSRGDIVGCWFDTNNVMHGHMVKDGQFIIQGQDFPDSRPGSSMHRGINKAGQIVGSYADANNRFHGYLLSDGQYTTIDFPEAKRTLAFKINNAGDIVGEYRSADNKFHGFLMTRR
jgi:uncharacterized membrane protein